MTVPLVSVVIPAYNSDKWIYDCLMSVIRQDYPNIEIIVVDDASKDMTKEFAIKILNAQTAREYQIISHAQNQGECIASHDGFAVASGRYICRLSSDDMYGSTGHISKQVRVMEKSGADWCYNSCNNVLEMAAMKQYEIDSFILPVPTRFCHKAFQIFDNLILKHPFISFIIISIKNPVNSSTLMIRKESYVKLKGGWKSGKHRTDCDGLLILKMCLAGFRGCAVKDIGCIYRIHENQGSNAADYQKTIRDIRKELYENAISGDYPVWLKAASKILRRVKHGKN